MRRPRVIDLAALAGPGAAGPVTGGAGGAAAEARGHDELVEAVERAHLVCFPTDTVYGIGGRCRAHTYKAIAAAKGRGVHERLGVSAGQEQPGEPEQPGASEQPDTPDKPLQVVFPTLDLLLAALRPEPSLAALLRRLLPGALTLVVPYPEGFDGPPGGRAEDGSPTLGVRVPQWPPAARAMTSLPWPLVASSANLSGARAARHVADVPPSVRAACDLMLDGGEVGGVASTVVDLTGFAADRRWRVLRDGAVERAELVAVLGLSPGR